MTLFRGQLVRLTAISRDHLPDYRRWFRDYEVQRFLSRAALPVSDQAEEAWFEEMAKSKDVHLFDIQVLEDDRLIGNCSLFKVHPKNRVADFGIVIGEKDCWGKGYGTDAARTILRYAFHELNLNRVQLEVYDFNPRGMRAYEKAGFQHEGTRRSALYREGAYHDVHVMGILQADWRQLEASGDEPADR